MSTNYNIDLNMPLSSWEDFLISEEDIPTNTHEPEGSKFTGP